MFEKYKEENKYRKGIPFLELDKTIDQAVNILFEIYQTNYEKLYPLLLKMTRGVNSGILISLNISSAALQEKRLKKAYYRRKI